MNSSYIKALETRARWLKWSKAHAYEYNNPDDRIVVPAYEQTLESNNVYFMNKKFCSLVDHARRTVPDDLAFDSTWAATREGWMFLEEPFLCPNFVVNDTYLKLARDKGIPVSFKKEENIEIRISAIGWISTGKITTLKDGRRYAEHGEGSGISFLCFHDLKESGYGMWSYFSLGNEEKVIDRIQAFESTAIREGGAYANDRIRDEMHEIRWVYTAFYLMAQRLAVQLSLPLDRAAKRRAQRENRREPDAVKVVSLRKLEAARKENENADEQKQVDWQWQWEVRGHWRNQFYPAANEHRPVFVEAYIKGPNDKPIKPPTVKLFAAVR